MRDLTRKRAWALLAVIIALQCAVMAYWAGQKQNLFLDECYSLTHARAAAFPGLGGYDFPDSTDWETEEWLEADMLRNHLVVDRSGSVFRNPESVKFALFKVRSYYVLLNVAESALCPGRIDTSVAFWLNAALFVVSQVVLYAVARGLGCARWSALLAALMYGSSSMAITHVVYVRFYTLVNLLMLLVVLLHERMWESGSIPRFVVGEVLSLALMYNAARNSEFVMVVGGVLIVAYGSALLLRGRRIEATLYLVPTLAVGAWYLVRKTSALRVFVHLSNYVDHSMPLGMIARTLLNLSPELVASNLEWVRYCFDWLLVGGPTPRDALALIAVAMCVLCWHHHRDKADDSPEDPQEAGPRSAQDWTLVVVLLVCVVGHALFISVTGLTIPRYVSLSCPIAACLLWTILGWLAGHSGRPAVFCSLLALAVLVGTAGPFLHQSVEYLYPEDARLWSSLEEYRGTDVVLAYDDSSSMHVAFDCVCNSGDGVRIYPVTDGASHIEASSCPGTVLVWTTRDLDPRGYVGDLLEAGYELEYLESDHESDVYVCSLRTGGPQG